MIKLLINYDKSIYVKKMFLLFICKITELCDLISEDYTLSNFLVLRRDVESHLARDSYLKYQPVLIN